MNADLERARANVTASSLGGAPFLLSFGLTLTAAGLAGFVLTPAQTALVALFQGNLALPLAFLLERTLRVEPMTPDNPLRALSVQLAISQLFALPGAIIVYVVEPGLVPAMVAFVAAAHLVPYAWLQRTAAYVWVSAAVSGGALVITALSREASGPWVLLMMGAVYWTGAAFIYRRASALIRVERAVHAPAAS